MLKGANTNPGARRHLAAREREVKALELRKAGWSYPKIGRELGVSQVAAYKIVMRVLDRFGEKAKEDAEKLRAIELHRLETMHAAIWPKAKRGNLGAIAAELKIA